MSKGSSAPPAPDYAGAAQAQGAANVETARVQGKMSNPNYDTPLGYRRVTWQGDQPLIADTLTNAGQQRFDQEQRIITQLGGQAEAGLGQVNQAMGTPFNPNNLPPQATQVYSPDVATGVGGVPLAGSYNTGQQIQGQVAPAGQIQTSLQQQNPYGDFSQDRMRVENAMMGRVNEDFNRRQQSQEAELLARGVQKGSQAYNWEMDQLNRARNDANFNAIMAGGQEQSRLFGLANQAGQFANTAQQQQYGQNLQGGQFANQAALSQDQRNAALAGFYNQAQQQQFQNQMANANLYNQAGAQQFNQGLQAAQFGNQARQQSLQEQLALRQLPLNELNALRTGAPVNLPQFQQFNAPQPIQPAPIYNAAVQQGNWDLANANANAASGAAFTQGLFGLGGAGLMAYGMSDIRLKSNIVRVGTHPLGVGVYEYDIGGERRVGVMAQELASVMPDAVMVGADGFMRVNYGRL